MGLMLSVLIFCVGVIEAIAWTQYLRHTCMPCSYHRRMHSKPLWSSRKSFSKMRSNSDEYALHHEAKCVCSNVHQVDISWPRSFSLDVSIKEGNNNDTVEGATENYDEKISNHPTHASSNKFLPLIKRDSNASENSIDELEEIGFKDEPLPSLVRQYSEDSWSGKKRSDSENSVESFEGFKTSKVNICWPRPFTPEDLRVIKKRNRNDSEQSVDEVEELLGEPRLKPPNVLRVISSSSESSDDEEITKNITDNKNENSDYITQCVNEGAQHDNDTEVANLFIKPDCKLELKRNNCHTIGTCSNVFGMAELNNASLLSGLPEIPETDVLISVMSEDKDIKEHLINNNSDLPRFPVQHRDRVPGENERDCEDLQGENNQNGRVAYGCVESEIIADNDSSSAIIFNDDKLLETDNIGTLEMPVEGSKKLSENISDETNKATTEANVLESARIGEPMIKISSAEARQNHSYIQYETPVQGNIRDVWEESSDNDVASSSPVSLEVNTDNSDNRSLANNYAASSRTSETVDEVSEISEKELKELSENSSDMMADVVPMIHGVSPGVEETNGLLAETLDSHDFSGNGDRIDSENSEREDLFYVKSDRIGSECEENEDIDGDRDLSRNYDELSEATESDCEDSEISEKEYFTMHEATECLRSESDIPSSYYHIETTLPNDGSVYLCKAKESKESNFEESGNVRESNTVILKAVVPELVEQVQTFQRLDNKDVCGIEATSSESSRYRDENIRATEEFVETPQGEVDKAFWLIFSGEYTKAMSKDWHSGHFCCWQCDESLTGQRYVLRDDHPYCVKCYESVFANGCEECSKIIGIDSKDLSYKDKHWHEACFLCNKCRVSLVDKQFGSKVDKIYCGNCYDQQFASRCDGCGQIFRAGTKKMEYKTRQWHEPCFCCCVCKTPIGTKSFIPREQEIYCATCYEEKFATRCVKCNKIITSGGVTYKNEPWHRECFTCTNCNTSLAGQRFTSRDEKPYCADCFGELFAKRCTACCKPITGIGGTRFISFEDRHWHNDCFICASCKTSLVGRGFITDGDDIICPDCAKQKLM